MCPPAASLSQAEWWRRWWQIDFPTTTPPWPSMQSTPLLFHITVYTNPEKCMNHIMLTQCYKHRPNRMPKPHRKDVTPKENHKPKQTTWRISVLGHPLSLTTLTVAAYLLPQPFAKYVKVTSQVTNWGIALYTVYIATWICAQAGKITFGFHLSLVERWVWLYSPYICCGVEVLSSHPWMFSWHPVWMCSTVPCTTSRLL